MGIKTPNPMMRLFLLNGDTIQRIADHYQSRLVHDAQISDDSLTNGKIRIYHVKGDGYIKTFSIEEQTDFVEGMGLTLVLEQALKLGPIGVV